MMASKKAMKKERKAKPKSFREGFKFWLDLNKQVEADLADAIFQLKRTRQFASTIRDALRLILTLRLGDVSVLEALFPGIVKQLVAANTNHELADLRRELSDLRERVATSAVVTPAAASGLGGLQKLSKATIKLDDDDDEPAFVPQVRKLQFQDTGDTIVVKQAEPGKNGEVLLAKMLSMFD